MNARCSSAARWPPRCGSGWRPRCVRRTSRAWCPSASAAAAAAVRGGPTASSASSASRSCATRALRAPLASPPSPHAPRWQRRGLLFAAQGRPVGTARRRGVRLHRARLPCRHVSSRHASPGRHGRARGRVRVGVDDGQGCVRRRRFIRAGYGAILGLDVVLRNTKLGRQTTAGQKMKHAHQVSVPELGEWLSDTRQGTCARGRVGAGALGGAGAYDRHSAGGAQLSRVSKCLARLTTAAAVTSKIHGVAQTVLVAALTESYARDVPVGEMREGCTERNHRSQRPRLD